MLARGFVVVGWGGGIFLLGTPGLELWSAHRLSWLRLYAAFTQCLETSVSVELQMTPRPLPDTLFFFSRRHNPLWVCIYSPLAGFSLLFRGS